MQRTASSSWRCPGRYGSLVHRLSRPHRARTSLVPRAAAAAPVAPSLPTSTVLDWACSGWAGPDASASEASWDRRRRPASPPQLRVAVADLGPGRGRGLMATEDLAPGETLLSVPLTRVFASDPDAELHWSADMALRLLRARHRSRALAAAGAGAGAGAAAGSAVQGAEAGEEEVDWGPWIQALPAHVRTPLEYDDDEVRQLGCPYMQEEVVGMQECIGACFEAVEGELAELGCGWSDFLWAVQVFHSRCFFEPTSGRHLCVPGVDMANHAPAPAAPSAGVGVVRALSQGWDAVAEVAEPPPPEPSRFALVAGEAGIRRGEEVTISYGGWPSEAFLLLFGFVPLPGGGAALPGPSEALTLFGDGREAAAWALEAARGAGAASESAVDGVLAAVEAAMPGAMLQNLMVTGDGVDGRLQLLLDVVAGANGAGAEGGAQGLSRALVRRRVEERMRHFVSGDSTDETIAAFKSSKRALCEKVLSML